jgi:hypothetical protein
VALSLSFGVAPSHASCLACAQATRICQSASSPLLFYLWTFISTPCSFYSPSPHLRIPILFPSSSAASLAVCTCIPFPISTCPNYSVIMSVQDRVQTHISGLDKEVCHDPASFSPHTLVLYLSAMLLSPVPEFCHHSVYKAAIVHPAFFATFHFSAIRVVSVITTIAPLSQSL